MSIGAVACAIGWVEGSLSCYVMSSTSSNRFWNSLSLAAKLFIWAVVCTAVSGDLDLVALS